MISICTPRSERLIDQLLTAAVLVGAPTTPNWPASSRRSVWSIAARPRFSASAIPIFRWPTGEYLKYQRRG